MRHFERINRFVVNLTGAQCDVDDPEITMSAGYRDWTVRATGTRYLRTGLGRPN